MENSKITTVMVKSDVCFDKNDPQKKYKSTGTAKKYAGVIAGAIERDGICIVRSVLQNASYNALKAISIAKGFLEIKGIKIVEEISFITPAPIVGNKKRLGFRIVVRRSKEENYE